LVVVVATAALLALVWWRWASSSSPAPADVAPQVQRAPAAARSDATVSPESAPIHGHEDDLRRAAVRGAADAVPPPAAKPLADSPAIAPGTPASPGQPGVIGDLPPASADAVRAALATGDAAAMTESAVLPPFDAAAYAASPQTYLDRVEPARAFQPLPPQNGAVWLEQRGDPGPVVNPGGRAMLTVQVGPGQPVTFTSLGLGAFANGRTSISVAADGQGVASVVWTASPGTTDVCDIRAASPLAVGQGAWSVRVRDADAEATP
jgi:hypothetical protein